MNFLVEMWHLKSLWRLREITICTETKTEIKTVRILTVIQLDADVMTLLSRDDLTDIRKTPEIWKKHLRELERSVRAIRRIKVLVNSVSIAGLPGLAWIGYAIFS